MTARDDLNLSEGSIVALPFFENEKFVVGSKRGGGMGNVYQLLPLQPAALPLALKTYHGNGDYAQFEREARIWISLGTHPNIARAITYGQLNGVRCILASWYSKSLINIDSRHLSREEVFVFVYGLLTGLQDAERKFGLIHKDIKPANILVDDTGVPRLADFGISSLVPPDPAGRQPYANTVDLKKININRNSIVSGTPLYMAPELFHGYPNSIQTDIFALGVTLFEWLSGVHPYLNRQGNSDYGRLPAFVADVRNRYGDEVEPLIKLIFLAIQLDADERPQSYSDLLGQSAYPASSPTSSSASSRKRAAIFEFISCSQVLRRQGKIKEAVSMLKDELEMQPKDPVLLAAYATTLIKIDQLKIAIPYLEQAVAINRENKNSYLDQPYVEPNVNLACLLIAGKQFDQAAALLKEASSWLKAAKSDLSFVYWEFAWLSLYDGRADRAAQRLLYYMSRRSTIEPVIALFCLAAYISPNKQEYFKRCFDLIAAAGCDNAKVGLFHCMIASHLDAQRLHKFTRSVLTPKLASDLDELSMALNGTRNGFRPPMNSQDMRRLMVLVDDKYCGGKYRGIL
jgi:serine/threonine protein kinase